MPATPLTSAPTLLRQLAPFHTATLSALRYADGQPARSCCAPSRGRLPGPWWVQLREAWERRRTGGSPTPGALVYFVRSYATPIAWLTADAYGATLIVPDLTYSLTTSRHQNLTHAALAAAVARPAELTPAP